MALDGIKNNKKSPVWLGDPRISIAASSSIDRATVNLNKGEMSFQIFDCDDPAKLDAIIAGNETVPKTLRQLAKTIGEGLPDYLIAYLDRSSKLFPDTLAIHACSSIANYGKSADQKSISRPKGFMGRPQLELAKFPNAVHHVKVFHNGQGKARVFYKHADGVTFVQNLLG